MVKHLRLAGSRPYLTNYSEDDIARAMTHVNKEGMSLGRASELCGVPKSTLWRKVRNKHPKKVGGQLLLSSETEIGIVGIVNRLTEWKVPLDGCDIRALAKNYLD